MAEAGEFTDIDDSVFADNTLESWIGSLNNSVDLPSVSNTSSTPNKSRTIVDPLSIPCVPWIMLYKRCLLENKNQVKSCEKTFDRMDTCTAKYFFDGYMKLGTEPCSNLRKKFLNSDFSSHQGMEQTLESFYDVYNCIETEKL